MRNDSKTAKRITVDAVALERVSPLNSLIYGHQLYKHLQPATTATFRSLNHARRWQEAEIPFPFPSRIFLIFEKRANRNETSVNERIDKTYSRGFRGIKRNEKKKGIFRDLEKQRKTVEKYRFIGRIELSVGKRKREVSFERWAEVDNAIVTTSLTNIWSGSGSEDFVIVIRVM